MPAVRESTSAVVVRGEQLVDGFVSEPYEAGWASEAIVFVVGMDANTGGSIAVQISPDGILWVDEGLTITMPGRQEVAFGRLAHFGNWIRIRVNAPNGTERRMMVTLHLKG